MSQQDDHPTIDSLLEASNWEERLAEARARREIALAAKTTAPAQDKSHKAPKADQTPLVAAGVDHPIEITPSAPSARAGLFVAGIIGITVGAAAGGLGVWYLQSDQTTPEIARPQTMRPETPREANSVTRQNTSEPKSVIRPRARTQTPTISAVASPVAVPPQIPNLQIQSPAPTARYAASQATAPALTLPVERLSPVVPSQALELDDTPFGPTVPAKRPDTLSETGFPQRTRLDSSTAAYQSQAADAVQRQTSTGPLSLPLAEDALPETPSTPLPFFIKVRVYQSAGSAQDQKMQIDEVLREAGLRPPESINLAFANPQTEVRFYHRDDAATAQRIAAQLGRLPRDFTAYAPAPPKGTIDVYLAD